MRDLQIALVDRPGALADMGEALGRAGISILGGGVFHGVAHFLVHDGQAARTALEAHDIVVVADRAVLVQRLRQGEPGQLGKFARALADAGVNIEVQYSDHDHQLIVVVDDIDAGRIVSDAWMRDR
ncbi:MAG: amino acid-binding ACT domain-containing protein [Gemmatimonadaceae bacterium]|nr:amino acid-binding ACT domain-containing protein [Gemmatimonadaceae bacterium]